MTDWRRSFGSRTGLVDQAMVDVNHSEIKIIFSFEQILDEIIMAKFRKLTFPNTTQHNLT